jgi:hypothetical protein
MNPEDGSAHAHVWQYRKGKYCRKAFRECGLCGRLERSQHILAAGGGMRWTPWELLFESRSGFPLSPNATPSATEATT